MSGATICHGCGQRLEVPEDYQRAKMRCPDCGVMCEVPPVEARKGAAKKSKGRAAPAVVAPSAPKAAPPPIEADLPIPFAVEPALLLPPAEPDLGTDEDDGKPYRLSDRASNKCPECSAFIRPEEQQCPRCGFDRASGKKPSKSFTPMARSWEAGWSLQKRRNFYLLGLLLASASGFGIAWVTDGWAGYIGSLIYFAVMMAFLLGTYARLDLVRTKRGRVTLTKTWRILFFERPSGTLNVLEFEGVRAGLTRSVGFLDWFLVFMLLGGGLLPGILWWYFFVQLDQHYVALLKEHGYPSDMLYLGMNEALAKEIAETLRDVAGLPYEQG